jgi:murein DD-endopeptidase MepM/ murein hydrolase activator NlpD
MNNKSNTNFVIIENNKDQNQKTKSISKPNKFLLSILFIFQKIFDTLVFGCYRLVKYSNKIIVDLVHILGHFLLAFRDEESRHLLKLEFNINYKIWWRKKQSQLEDFGIILSKFYLLIIVLIVIFSVKTASTYSKSNLIVKSFLGQFFDNYSIYNNKLNQNVGEIKALATKDKKITDLERIKKHEVKEGETLDSISEKYGLLPDTISINNNLEKDKPLPSVLYFPWQDSYIYFTKFEIPPRDIATFYGISENLIYSQNEDIINFETGKFPKDQPIIIPTKDFASIRSKEIEAKNKEDKEQVLQKIAQTYQTQQAEQKKIAQIISNKIAPSSNNFNNNPATQLNNTTTEPSTPNLANSTDKRSTGFIWPTKGSISRCLEPGHIACDIANNSMPPVYAVADGVVSDVYRFSVYGYGNAIVIDHGNGLKTLYAHLNDIYISKGQVVTQGQAIGQMGNTGNSTGTHLHLEVMQNGVKLNPIAYLP